MMEIVKVRPQFISFPGAGARAERTDDRHGGRSIDPARRQSFWAPVDFPPQELK
jgi:hypothetical protein